MDDQQQGQDQNSPVLEPHMHSESSQSPVDGVGGDPSEVATATTRIRHQVGSDADDVLVATPGRERLIGGKGSDTYIVGDEHSTVLEKQDEGWDTVRASVGFTLSNHVERLELTGDADLYGGGNSGNNRLIGNVGKPVRIQG